MATEAMVETTVQAAEVVAEPATEVAKKFPKGKTALIVGGTAMAVVGGYFLIRKVIIPSAKKHNHKRYDECEPVEEEPKQEETKEKEPEKEARPKKK